MKSVHTFIIGMTAIACLASCELKRELFGIQTDVETGALELGVNVKLPASQTRTDGEETTVSTDNFALAIQGTGDVSEVSYTYDAVTEFAPIILPVGTYTVSAHSPGELQKKMTEPYYQGSKDIAITTGITTVAEVECRRANSRIQLVYGEDFRTSFTEWTITIDDGSDMVLTFTQDDQGTTPIYWHFGDNVTTITVNVTAKTIEGNTTFTSHRFEKGIVSEGYGESDNFAGGDAVVINMGVTESLTGNVTGITINTDITFEDQEESVEIPAVDENQGGSEEPGTGGEDEPGGETGAVTLNLPTDVTYSIEAGDAPSSADAYIASEAGLESILVTIVAGNQAFQEILADLTMDGQSFLNSGVDLIDNNDFNTLLESTQAGTAPKNGDTEYTFPIGVFFTFLNATGATDTGTPHEFHITVTDKNGKQATGIFKVTINE